MKKLIFFLFIFLRYADAYSQDGTGNRAADTFYDSYGKKYSLSDIKVDQSKITTTGPSFRSTNICTSGIFDLYFENGSGMEDPTNATHNQRRAVVCQVFQDISDFLNSPLHNVGNPNRVRILVQNPIDDDPSAATSTVLASASAFYPAPANTIVAQGGIVDGSVWQTILSGEDVNASGGAGLFYNASMMVNFVNTSLNWNTDLSIPAPSDKFDLYTTVLHEVMHAMGFVSFINENGQTVLPTGTNYYTRYDRFLQNAGSQPLVVPAVAAASMYDYHFNVNTNALHPNCPIFPPVAPASIDHTVCGDAVNYVGTTYTVPVYTPTCYEEHSSLGHFEDECFGYGNNAYFAMSNANGMGVTKRFLQVEERQVLCDIGYSVKTTFGDNSRLNFVDYGTSAACGGIRVVGMDDGISGGNYTIVGNTSATPNIPITGFLLNDHSYDNAFVNSNPADLAFEFMQTMDDPASALTISGNNVTFHSTIPGIHVLRYVPFSISTGQRGNITYIYIYVTSNNCIPTACNNLINNGGFENINSCGQFIPTAVNCWVPFNAGSPYIISRGCTVMTSPAFPNGTFNTGINTMHSNPPADTHNGAPNDNFVAFISAAQPEAAETVLNHPLIANNSYTLSFWARTNNNMNPSAAIPINFSTVPNLILLNYFSSLAALANDFNVSFPDSNEIFRSQIAVPNDSQWHYYTTTFTHPNGFPDHNVLVLYGENTATTLGFVFIDDVSLIPTPEGGQLNLPPTICTNQSIPDLSNFLSGVSPLGVFEGPPGSITLSGGVYSLNAAALGAGTHQIAYTYFDGISCSVTISDTITVNACNTTAPPTFTGLGPYCIGSIAPPLPTTSINGISGTWNPSVIDTSETGTLPYTFTPGFGQNGSPITINIAVTGTVPAFPKFHSICYGMLPNYALPTVSNNDISGTWDPPFINNLVTTVYTFTPDPGQCAVVIVRTIVVRQPSTPTFDPIGPICIGQKDVSLPASSLEEIPGHWGPEQINNSETTTYTFYPDDGYCASSTTITVEVGNAIIPLFNPLPAICPEGTVGPLPTTSLNGIEGHWNEGDYTSETITFTFYPKEGQCADKTTLVVHIIHEPTFNPIAPICYRSTVNPLPSISLEGITGTWSPEFDSTQTTTYTFTPNEGQGGCKKVEIKIVVLKPEDPSCRCEDTLLILAPDSTPPLVYQRHEWIVAANDFSVFGDQDITMHAGKYVELQPKTMYESTRKFYAYIEDCCVTCRIKGRNTSLDSSVQLSIYPNPSNGIVEILMRNGTFNNITIVTMDGKKVYDSNFKSNNSYRIDLSSFTQGIYIINVMSDDGQLYKEKIIKN
jgi:hypothetical protein